LSQLCNTLNYTATAASLHVAVHVARIVRAKHTCLLRSFNCLVNSQLFRTVKQKGEIFKATWLAILYVHQFVSNSQLLLFHRAQNYVKYQGFVRNWKKTGYFEIIHQLRKLRQNSWNNAFWIHLDNVKIIHHKSFYITARYCEDNVTYWKLHWFMKTRLNIFLKNHSNNFRFTTSSTELSYWRWYCLDGIRTGVEFF